MELQQQSVKRFKTMLMSWVNLKQYHVPFILARLFLPDRKHQMKP